MFLEFQKEIRTHILAHRAINHQIRKAIMDYLHIEGQKTVTDIYIKLRLEQSVASQHLAILRRAEVVTTYRQGKNIFYSYNKEKHEKLKTKIKNLEGAAVLRAIAHPLRNRILNFLPANNVQSIYETLKLEQSVTSQHLNILADAGIIECEKEGKFHKYSVNTKLVNELKEKLNAESVN